MYNMVCVCMCNEIKILSAQISDGRTKQLRREGVI